MFDGWNKNYNTDVVLNVYRGNIYKDYTINMEKAKDMKFI